MRAPSLLGSVTAGLSTVLPFLATLLLSSAAEGIPFHPVSQPELDLSPLGRVALTGDFDAVSLYSYKEQANSTAPKNGTQSISTPLPNGVLTNLVDADGDILAMCSMTDQDGTAEVFVAGNFTSLGGVKAHGIAKFNPDTLKVTPLSGLSGSVSSLICDQNSHSVYAGGDFRFGNSTNAAAWVDGEGWKSLPFGGLNGPVTSLLMGDDDRIILGGAFNGVGNSTHSKKNLQVINLESAEVTSDAISPRSGFSSPKNVICQTSGEDGAGKTWLLYDKSPGYWRAEMGFGYKPTKVRLYNTHFEGRGTKNFLLRALPDNGIMNLTYTEPGSGDDTYCDSSCPLSSSTDEKYREFRFVNDVGMSGFQIEVLDWYGAGAGLNGIEIFQENIYSYAVGDYNEPSCAGTDYPSKSTRTGSWNVAPSAESQSGYLTTKVSDTNSADHSVVFEPDVKQSGNYSVRVYTPGCKQDGTCDSRGVVDVSATVSKASDADEPIQTTLYQTNYYEKYDTLYTGHVDASSGSFRPRVTLTPADNQNDITLVASSVRFELISASSNMSGDLNGLYEYDPATNKTEKDFSKSAANSAGLLMDDGASIKTMYKDGDTIYAGGNFSNSDIHNIMYFDDGNATALSRGGLNSEVKSIVALDDYLYMGGNFTDTADGGNKNLKHVAAYSFGSKTWSALGGGVNGPVQKVFAVPLNVSSEVNETTIAVSGDFDELLPFGNNTSISVAGFGIWVPSHKNWLQNINDTGVELGGQLTASTTVGNTTLYGGSLSSGGIAAADAVSLMYKDGLHVDPLLTSKESVNSTGGTYIGIYDVSSGRNLTILGGQFTARASDGSTIKNLIVLDGDDDSISGIGQGIDSNSTFMTLAVADDTLYAGGNVTGAVGKANIELNGLVAWDLSNNNFARMQPPALNGDDVVVNSVAPRPGSKDVYIGGNFQGGGLYPCPSVCIFDPAVGQYNRPGSSLSGTVLELKWATQNELIAIGDLQIDDTKTAVAKYNVKKDTWKAFNGASTFIPGSVTAFTPASQDVSVFWVAGQTSNGSVFLTNYDGSGFQTTGDLFGQGTTIRGLEILPLASDHDQVDNLNKDQTLLITGQLNVPDFGNASSALFNGTAVTPFILSSSSDGQPGSMSQMFYEKKNPYARQGSSLQLNV